MKTIIIHHVNEDFTEERVETITMRGGCIVSITYSETIKKESMYFYHDTKHIAIGLI